MPFPTINKEKIIIVVMLCGTLGLAPFTPEPHLLGKIKWIVGGAEGMALMDWFDTFLHGFPWLLLFTIVAIKVFDRPKNKKYQEAKKR